MESPQPVHYLPIATTVVSLLFLLVLTSRAMKRGWPPHLIWWGVGVFFYGFGTALESAITLHGNSVALNRFWYIAGAILGGYPLATGSVYFLLSRKIAHTLTGISLSVVLVTTFLVLVCPIEAASLEPHRPSGSVLQWQWVRWMTPFINLYAAIFLIGGAFYSAARFLFLRSSLGRAIGTFLIAVGAILPGIGGGYAKAGYVEALYVGELGGLILIWIGYEVCVRSPLPQREDS